jgi:uncharacterized phiE125 gp8 family phage protein
VGLALLTAPDAEVVELDEFKQHARIDLDDEDDRILGYLLAARQYLEEIANRGFITQTWTLTLDGEWPDEILLGRAPVDSITSITYVDWNGATQTLASNQYVLVNSGVLSRVVPAYGVYCWPPVRSQPNAITVTFVVGYGDQGASVPEPIRQAIILLAAHLHANREPVGDNRLTELPFAVSALIAPYRAWPL